MKGQNLRLFIGSSSSDKKPIAHALDCTLHLGTSVEDDSDKDSDGDWGENVVTAKNWDVSANAKFNLDTDSGAKTTSDIIAYFGTEVYIELSPASGTKNRTAGTAVFSGKAILSDLNIQSANKQTVTAAIQLTGNGPLS